MCSRVPERLCESVHKVKLLNDRVMISCAIRCTFIGPFVQRNAFMTHDLFVQRSASFLRPVRSSASVAVGLAADDQAAATALRILWPAHSSDDEQTAAAERIRFHRSGLLSQRRRQSKVRAAVECEGSIRPRLPAARSMGPVQHPRGRLGGRGVHDRGLVRLSQRRALHRAPEDRVSSGPPVRKDRRCRQEPPDRLAPWRARTSGS